MRSHGLTLFHFFVFITLYMPILYNQLQSDFTVSSTSFKYFGICVFLVAVMSVILALMSSKPCSR